MAARFGYAINQWKPNFDYFTRREQHERALKTLSASGFRAIELRAGTGRWEPLGRPEQIAANFGSADGFVSFLRDCGVDDIASFFFDPSAGNTEEPAPPRSAAERADHAGILESCRIFAGFLQSVGGTCLVVRPVPSYWREGPLTPEKIVAAAGCWNAVGAMTAEHGVRTALHVDFLSSLRAVDDIDALLEHTDPGLVGLALDTAELTIAGIDPVALAERHGSRVWHVHLKDARAVDVDGEYATPNADKNVLLAGGKHGVERWFWELGEGSVDFPSLMDALRRADYDGWLIVESDQSPEPAGSAMLNGWTVQHVLSGLI